jgi:hypothetical protein
VSFSVGDLVDFYTWKDKTKTKVNKHNGKITRAAPYLIVLDLDTNKKYKFHYKGNSLKNKNQRMVYNVGEYFTRLVDTTKVSNLQGLNSSNVFFDEGSVSKAEFYYGVNPIYNITPPNDYNESILIDREGTINIVNEAWRTGLISPEEARRILDENNERIDSLFGIAPQNELVTASPLTPEMIEEAAQAAIRNFGRGRNG